MSRPNWTAVLVFGAVVVLVVVIGCGLLWILFRGFGGMMGPGITGPGGMMGGWCPWCGGTGVFGGGTLAGLFLFFIVLVVLGLLGLLVVGAVWLARSTGKDENSTGSN
jgi:hypothetical protein